MMVKVGYCPYEVYMVHQLTYSIDQWLIKTARNIDSLVFDPSKNMTSFPYVPI